MNRSEALKQFKEAYAEAKVNEKLFALEDYYRSNRESLAEGFVESFRQICLKIAQMQEKGLKEKIAYINYSLLRTAISDNKPAYLIEAFDSQWFLDFEECHGYYDASWALGYLEEIEKELEDKRKLYMGAVLASDVVQLKLKEAVRFGEYVASLARYAMPMAASLKEYREIKKDEELEVRTGEYRDMSELVYKEDTRVKDPKKVREWLEEKLEDEYTYEAFRNLDLSKGNYKDADFSYADFTGSRLENCNMAGCTLVGAKYTDCVMEGTDLSSSRIFGADFTGCSLRKACFYRAEGASGTQGKTFWERPGFMGVSFKEADLEGADFEGADLRGAIFTGAKMNNVNFQGANLKDAIMLKKEASLLDLDQHQIDSIIWRP